MCVCECECVRCAPANKHADIRVYTHIIHYTLFFNNITQHN
jgi:hypothetical protein